MGSSYQEEECHTFIDTAVTVLGEVSHFWDIPVISFT